MFFVLFFVFSGILVPTGMEDKALGGALHQLHYEFSTNLGLCQSNMTFLVKRKGSSYHWARDLFAKMGLPEVDGLYDIVTKENVERMRRLERQKTDKAKKQQVTFKQKRQQERQEVTFI